MKKAIIIAIAILASANLRAQEVKPIESSVEDYIALLNQNGYQAYSFDISPMKTRPTWFILRSENMLQTISSQ